MFCQEIRHSLHTVGFIKLVNHGISGDTIDKAFHWNKRFFDLPLEVKNQAAHPAQPNPHRGYTYVGQEKLSRVADYEKGSRDAKEVYDIKESFDQGPTEDELYPNRWPNDSEIPGFQSFMEHFYDTCHHVHLKILDSLAIGLGLEKTFLRDLCAVNTSELRLNHYPACETGAITRGEAKRISEHTDFGTLTLLFQDSVGGLEVEAQDEPGCYFPVAAEDRYEMIINVGDCLQRWTNNKYRSTSHRVVLPPQAGEWIPDRYSIAYFAKPNREQTVGPLEACLAEGEKPKYDHVSAWEYNQRKLLLTYCEGDC